MSITTPNIHVPSHRPVRARTRHHVGWLLVALAVIATAALAAFMVLDDSSDQVAPGVEISGEEIESSARARIASGSGSVLDASIAGRDHAPDPRLPADACVTYLCK